MSADQCTCPACDPAALSEALDAWEQRQQDEARDIVRSYLGLPK